MQYDESSDSLADLNINLEVAPKHHLALAPESWVFVNPEWLKPEFLPIFRDSFSRIFAKTHDAERICKELFGHCIYTGFLVRDQMDTSIKRERRFLHIGGNSTLRNTRTIIQAWELMENPYPLTIVSRWFCEPVPGIEFYEEVTEHELKELQNSHLFHLYPSGYEGFGHALHESQSVGASLLTTLAPPMDEFDAQYYVKPIGTTRYNHGSVAEVPVEGVRAAAEAMWDEVEKGLNAPAPEVPQGYLTSRILVHDPEARSKFEGNNKRFEELFGEVIDGFTAGNCSPVRPVVWTRSDVSSDARCIAILGNFGVSYSTESELAWSFRHLGHNVIELQEGRATGKEIVSACLMNNVDAFVWIHTHTWETPGDPAFAIGLDAIKKAGIPTIGFHLDRYWGLNILDGREDGIGNTPWWQCDFVFTADGGNQERFKARGVRHVWLPPGVVERGVHYGRFRPEFDCDVAFVGSRNYHPEYPFRGELISWLEITYGKRFKLITGVREGDLNDAYASAKVVVGDSCFAGEPYYWSDRVPETVGRGGYLIHPFSEGMHAGYCLPYVGLEHLRQQIEDSLELPEMRRKWVRYQMEIVRQHETYSQRVQTILETVGVVRKSEDREILHTSSDRVHEMRSGSDGT